MQGDYLKVVAGHIKRDALETQINIMHKEIQTGINKRSIDCIILRQYIEANLVRHALIHNTYIFRPNGAKLDIIGVNLYHFVNKNQFKLNSTIKLYAQISHVIHEGEGTFVEPELLNLMNFEFKQRTFNVKGRIFIYPSILTVRREALYNQIYTTTDFIKVKDEVDLIFSVLAFSKTSKINKTISLIDARSPNSEKYLELKAQINETNNQMHFSLKNVT